MSSVFKIKIFDARGTQILPIDKANACVGRAEHCDLRLDDPSIAAEHARAWSEGGRVWLQDLGSEGGTFLNGTRLPILKPMLVRAVDSVRMGKSEVSLSFEPGPAREDEITRTDVKPMDWSDNTKRTRLDSDSPLSKELEDMRRHVGSLSEELERGKRERQRREEHFHNLERDKKKYRKQIDDELAEYKLRALRETKELREDDARRFEEWKQHALSQLQEGVRRLGRQKSKTWAAQPITKDMIVDLESDLNRMLKRVLSVPGDAVEEVSQVSEVIPSPDGALVDLPPPAPNAPAPAKRAKSSSTSRAAHVEQNEFPWHRAGVLALVLAGFLSLFYFSSAKMRRDRSSAARAVAAVPNETARPAPRQAVRFQTSYTDSVSAAPVYLRAETSPMVRERWRQELTRKVSREWRLQERVAAQVLNEEWKLLQDLQALETSLNSSTKAQTLQRMRTREARFVSDLGTQFGPNVPVARFLQAKREFFSRNPVYLTSENR